MEVFSDVSRSAPPPAKIPFAEQQHHMVEDHFTTVKNRTIETDIAPNMVGNKTTNGTLVSQVSKGLDQNLARKFPELIPEESLPNVHPLVCWTKEP